MIRFFLSSLILFLFIIALFCACSSSNSGNDITSESRVSLNGTWKFKTDPDGIGQTQKWYKTNYNDNTWTDIDVPGNWNYLFRDSQIPESDTDYDDPAWYRTTFTPPYHTQNNTIILHFGAVCYKTTLWLNGEEIGSHEGDFVPFEFDISNKVKLGSENSLALYVETINKESEYTIPQAVGRYDYWIFSGIHRDVYLEYRNSVHVFDVFVKSEPVDSYSGSVEVDTRIVNTGNTLRTVDIRITLHERGQDGVLVSTSETCLVPGKTIIDKTFGLTLDSITPWHPDNPQLYECRVELSSASGTSASVSENDMESYDYAEKVPPHADLTMLETDNLDAVKTDFGIRKIEVQGTQILLNGEPIILTGINRHDEHPLVGRVYTDDMLLDDLRMMKKANINTLRTAHYPNDPRVYEFADQLGLLTFEELPCTSLGKEDLNNSYVRSIALDSARRMVHRDKNHPSIIIWSPGNEYIADSETISNFNSLIYEEFKSIDPTRLVTYARVEFDETTEDPDSDLVMINSYYGWYWGNIEDLPDKLDRMHGTFPDKPIILSEYGAGAIKDNRSLESPEASDHFTEDFQLHFLKEYWAIMKSKEFVAGGCIWPYADFITPLRDDLWSSQGRRPNPIPYHNLKGIIDRDRVPKNSYLTVMGMYDNQSLYHLTIIVTDSNDDPVNNADISITLQDGTWVGQQKTDAQGRTILWYVPPMQYTLAASSGSVSASTTVDLADNETVTIQLDI